MVLAATCVSQQGEPLEPEWCHSLPRPEYKSLQRADVKSAWFQVYRVRPGVFAIYEPHQFEEVISYLIVGKKRAVLLDTGMGVASIREVTEQLTSLPVTVVNTHTHFDHTGGNAEFTDIANEDTSYTRQNALGQSNEYSRDALSAERICGALPPGVKPESYAIRPWHVTLWLKVGEQFDLGGRTLEVLFTPGHTPDSLMLLDRANGLLFTGDTFYPGPIYLFVPETDFAAYARSVAKIAPLASQLQLLLPAHNVPVASPENLRRLREAVEAVGAGKAKVKVTDGRREYVFEGFSLLLAAK